MDKFQVVIRTISLFKVFLIGLFVVFYTDITWKPFGIYMCILSFFHFSEFYFTYLTNPSTLSLNSFLLNHSTQYLLAAVASWIEFVVERYFFPELKTYQMITAVGLILCIGGEILRKGAMLTAKTNFNHVVQHKKANDHVLITHGVYSFFRHPSYVGWFYWSIGTQLILINPICFIAYTIASWSFFNERIWIEEITLVQFFGEQYKKYQEKVGTGLPFIPGFNLEKYLENSKTKGE